MHDKGENIMDLQFTEEQMMMRDMVRDFAKNVIAPQVKYMEDGGSHVIS